MIYRELLGADFDRLPAALRVRHSQPGRVRAVGEARVVHEARWLARLLGFPREGEKVPVHLDILAEDNREVWIRRFGTSLRRSVQRIQDGLLVETMGPVQIQFQVRFTGRGLEYTSVHATMLGVPLPMSFDAMEEGSERSWTFEVNVRRLGSYRGSMELVA